MGMNVMDLIIHLRLEGPCDQYLVPSAGGENARPPGDESTDEGEATDKEEDSGRELIEEGDPEMKPMEEEDPKEGFSESEQEIIGEEDPEEDPEEDLAKDRAELTHEGYIGEELEEPRAESGVPEIKEVSIRIS